MWKNVGELNILEFIGSAAATPYPCCIDIPTRHDPTKKFFIQTTDYSSLTLFFKNLFSTRNSWPGWLHFEGIEYPAGVAWDETHCTIQYSTAAGRRDQRSTILLWTQSTDSEHWFKNWASPRWVLVRPSMDRMRSKILLWEIPELIQDCSDPNRACWLASKQDLNIVHSQVQPYAEVRSSCMLN